jgi:hypothetical protein
VVDLALGLRDFAKKGKIFGITQAAFRENWHRACNSLGLPHTGPPHVLRHTSPSEDLARGRSSLEGVRRRGRWRVLDSVQRYTKTFAITKFRSRMAEQQVATGQAIAENLHQSCLSAMQSLKFKTPLATALIASLSKRRGKEASAVDLEMPTTKAKTKGKSKKVKGKIEDQGEGQECELDSDAQWCSD